MQETREEAVKKLLNSYEAYYNIYPYEEDCSPLIARCEYFALNRKYVISKKAELWSANCEEFIYVISLPHLTLKVFETLRDRIYEDGMSRIHVGPGHMYSYITPIFICDLCDEDVVSAVKKCRIYKSFHFSLHGWMDFHVGIAELEKEQAFANKSGRDVAKILKKILFPGGKKRRA